MQVEHTIVFKDWPYLKALIEQKSYSTIFVLVDENTRLHCLPKFKEALDLSFEYIQIESGEQNKTLASCEAVWDQMLALGADRHSLCINLGGGVIGDLGGFCASTYMRGMDFIQVPTTLLSQVDASVGGKLGIDYKGMKNYIGLIKDPKAVFIDDAFLKTLPKAQLRSGYAEVLKHGIIASNSYWDLSNTGLPELGDSLWTSIIEGSVDIKKAVTQNDPEERGLRKILNFGHTVGHAIESIFLETEQPFLHGEAIAIGMVVESAIAFDKGMLKQDELNEISECILTLFSHFPNAVEDVSRIMALMTTDKKNKGGKILCSLPSAIGACEFDIEVNNKDLVYGLDYYRTLR